MKNSFKFIKLSAAIGKETSSTVDDYGPLTNVSISDIMDTLKFPPQKILYQILKMSVKLLHSRQHCINTK